MGPTKIDLGRFFILFPLAALLACSAGSNSSPNPTPSGTPQSIPDVTGNWLIYAPSNPLTPTVYPGPIADFTGSLQSSNGSVTGILRAFTASNSPGACLAFLDVDLTATGTVDSSGNLNLTVPIGGGTATITGTLGKTLQTYTAGTYQITGGSCAMSSTAMEIAQFASFTGTFTGTLYPAGSLQTPSQATVVTTVVTQSSSPNGDGMFPVIGTVTGSGACTFNFSFSDGSVNGNQVAESGNGPDPVVTFNAYASDPSVVALNVLGLSASSCNGTLYQGALTRQ